MHPPVLRYTEMIAKVMSENSIPGDTVHVKDADGNIVGKLKVVKRVLVDV